MLNPSITLNLCFSISDVYWNFALHGSVVRPSPGALQTTNVSLIVTELPDARETFLQVLSNAKPVAGRGGLQGCEMMRSSYCLDNRLTDGGQAVSLMGRQQSTAWTDCTTNYRPVLSSERAPQDEDQSSCPAKERKKKNLGPGPKRVPAPRRIGRVTVGHKFNSTQRPRRLSGTHFCLRLNKPQDLVNWKK
jgi:hypothetical protein